MKSEAAGRAAHQGLAGRLILFDLDGTLVDSTPGIWASVRVAAAELGRPEPTPEQLRGMVGPPLEDGFALVHPGGGADRAEDRLTSGCRAPWTPC